ncbi:MAG: metallophosphoesterase family protein [Clostridia bacterium]|nr:metallophosphoesterase family protein [Clostridia bacterium]
MKRILAVILTAAILVSAAVFSAGAVTGYDEWAKSWESIRSSDGYIILTPGADKTKMNFSWQSPFFSHKGDIIIGKAADLSDGTELKVSRSLSLIGMEWSNEATASELSENTIYYYQYFVDGTGSEIYSFRTDADNQTKVAFFTDSQIGRWRGSDDKEEVYLHDTYGWNSTLETVFENNDGIDFILSSGDQVEDSYSEVQYSMFESPECLRSVPVAPCVGNHDFYTTNFSHHFNTPNDKTFVPARWPGSNGYYFCYNDVLFIMLDSNNIVPASFNAVIKKAVKAYPDAKWRVVMMHHSPYDANAHKYFQSKLTRTTIAPSIDKYGIDLVLSGHDHYYSRSYIIKNNKVSDDKAIDNVYTNPNGTLYISGNTSSGCNYSGIDESNVGECCNLYIQNRIPTYSIVDFADGKLTVSTYEIEGNKMIDTVSIVK